jgi:hypothetical protein
MIKGIERETMIKRFVVEGEAPVDRPYSMTQIVAEWVEVTYERDLQLGWHVACVRVGGRRAKANGTAGGQWLSDDWYFDVGRAKWSNGDVEPPLRVTVLAMNRCPGGPSLVALVSSHAVDLDAAED